MSRIEKVALSRTKKINVELTDEEIAFMSNIFNTIINSDNYDSAMEYLAGINGMSISDIKFIRKVYCFYFADHEEKIIYNNKMKKLKRENRKRGFIDFSAMILITIFIGVIGITLAFLIYNLL